MKNTQTITAHMIVKNDDRWVWFAIQSILEHVDRFLITDTGSTDNTISIIRSIKNPKIEFNTHIVKTPSQVVSVRKEHLKKTKTDWLWMIDADEIYPEKTCKEIKAIVQDQPLLSGILVRRWDMLGDMFHYQPNEMVGGYSIFGKTAHYSPRLIRSTIDGLTLKGEYPNEGFYDGKGRELLKYRPSQFAITSNRYLHATYLDRSSLGATLSSTFHRRKYKQERGKKFPNNLLPEIFFNTRPAIVPNPLIKRDWDYEIMASILTPIKIVKRKMI